jgi:hypothetical protein
MPGYIKLQVEIVKPVQADQYYVLNSRWRRVVSGRTGCREEAKQKNNREGVTGCQA